MTTFTTGRQAEAAAVQYLERNGYTIRAQNWRTRYCEIDVIAQEGSGRVVFFEVKYRRSNTYGSGLEYITPQKLRQMHFAAELWVAKHNFSGDYTLGAVEVSGPAFEVTACLDDL